MIVDIILGLFILGLAVEGRDEHHTPLPMTQADIARPDGAPAIDLAPDLVALAFEELRCTRNPQPTPVLRRLMDDGLIRPESRMDIESFSCFPLTGVANLGPIAIDSVCGGVLDPAENAANPDLYPPNDQIHDHERFQVLAFGSDERMDDLLDFFNGMYGPRGGHEIGVTNSLYTPSGTRSEIFCDDILADVLGPAEAETGVPAPPAPQ
ncbi:MAG: hypothetical protein Q4G26_11535 [Paracoccus sp. (in: a-proteobacteria)]|nr:hypothetical protein [Paracoccus sp. (in: a-proteobacteria)]